MTITNTEIFLLCALGLAIAYALHVKAQRDTLACILKDVVVNESKYKELRDGFMAVRKAHDSKRV